MDEEHLIEFMIWKTETCQSNTVKAMLSALRKLEEGLMAMNWIREPIVPTEWAVDGHNIPRGAYPPDEAQRIVEHVSRRRPEYGQALRFILASGARIDEVFHLRSDKAFLAEGKVELLGKGGKTRRVRVLRKETLFELDLSKRFVYLDKRNLRAGLKALLATQPDLDPVGEAGEGSEAVRLAESLQPDVLLLDVTMPGNEHFAVLRATCERAPAVRVLLLTMHEDEALLREALGLGASGYVLKKAAESELLTAIRAVARGEAFVDPAMTKAMIEKYLGTDSGAVAERVQTNGLTTREIEILKLTAEGYTNKEIAEKLVISVKTVETHKAHIGEKIGAKSRVEWLRYAREKELLSPDHR